MNMEDCTYIQSSSEKSCLCLKVFVGKGVVAEKESTPWTLWAMLSQSPVSRQGGNLLAAFIMLGAWLLFAWMQAAGRNGSADVLRSCWKIVISMVLMQETWTTSIGGVGPGLCLRCSCWNKQQTSSWRESLVSFCLVAMLTSLSKRL